MDNSSQVIVLKWCLLDELYSLEVQGVQGNHEPSLQELILSLPDSLKNPGVLATLRDVYSQRLTIVGVSLVLVYQELNGFPHKGELDREAPLVYIQGHTLFNHSLLSSFLDTHGPVLITMLTVKAHRTFGATIWQIIGHIAAVN